MKERRLFALALAMAATMSMAVAQPCVAVVEQVRLAAIQKLPLHGLCAHGGAKSRAKRRTQKLAQRGVKPAHAVE